MQIIFYKIAVDERDQAVENDMVLPNRQFENLENTQNSRQSRIFYHEIRILYLIIFMHVRF